MASGQRPPQLPDTHHQTRRLRLHRRREAPPPFDFADRWDQLNEDEDKNVSAAIPVDFALYEVEFELILMRENEEPSAYLNPIIDRAISNLGLSR